MSPLAKTLSLTVALVAVLPVSNAFAAIEPASAYDTVTCVLIPRIDFQDQTIYPGGQVCVPTP